MLLLMDTFTLAFNVRAASAHAMPLGVRGDPLAGPDAVPTVQYDEQLGLAFAQNYTILAYNVTAVQQCDSHGYGPAYLLNGYTDAGYWYQVGLYYDWPNTDWVEWPSPVPSNVTGFGLSYEVWNNSEDSVFPADGGGGLDNFTGTVNAGDSVLLNLYFSNGNVTMCAYDWNTSASAQETYTAVGAGLFIGATQRGGVDAPWIYFHGPGYFTGLMTEWVHPYPYYGGEARVVYQDANSTLLWGYIWADEWVQLNGEILFNYGQQISFFLLRAQLQYFTTSGAAEAASEFLFITGEPIVDISPDSVIMDDGQSQLFTAIVVGGVSPYTYQWYLNGAFVSGATDANWAFTPTSAGSYTVQVKVTDSVGAQATSNIANVKISSHDVAVTNVSPYKTVVGQGFGLNISVTAADLGTYTETFNVTVYANTTCAVSENVTMQSGTYTNVMLTWNTTDFAYGNYTISAYAWPVPNETNTDNNNCTDGWVFVSIVGDINGVGIVNMKDIAAAAKAFGSTPSSSYWNANADINCDGIVNMKDIAIAARHFGQQIP